MIQIIGEYFLNSVQYLTLALSKEWVQACIIPIFVAIVAIGFKVLSRWGAKGKYTLSREDRLIGFELGLTACVALVVSITRLSVKVQQLEVGVNVGELVVSQPLHEQERKLIIGIIGAAILLLFFVALLGLGAYKIGTRGWTKSNPAELSEFWVHSINALGLLLLVITTFWLGEPK